MCKHCDCNNHIHDSEHHHQQGHEHEHHHEHHGEMKESIIKISVATALLITAVVLDHNIEMLMWQRLVVYFVPYLIVGFGTIREALEGIAHGNIFNEHFLMTIATAGALAIGFMPNGEPEFTEAVFVMLFFQVGELFEGYAEGQSRKSIAHLMNIRPDTASVERGGEVLIVSPEEVEIGETIVVKPGERIPLDGIVVEGSSSLDTSALTGESVPREVTADEEVVSGCINLTGVLQIRTIRPYGESTVSKILELMESAGESKSRSETFIARFARVYTPVVVLLAFIIAFVPPLFYDIYSTVFTDWLYKALTFLIVSCPCALVISVPLTFYGGMGGASRKGVLVKGANYMDILANLSTVVFDKTGTLTRGRFTVTAVHPDDIDETHLLHLAAHVEHFTTHPIGAALRDAFPMEATDGCSITDIEEIAGQGVRASVTLAGSDTTHKVSVGNTKLMDSIGAQWHDCHHTGTIIHVAIDGRYAGHVVINDQIKEDSKYAIAELKALGVERTVMLTGDRKTVAENVARELNIDEWHAELLPADKVAFLDGIGKGSGAIEERHGSVAFVGDGINDAPVLARADVGIAMGGLGSDAAIEAADVVLMDDQPSKIVSAITLARHTLAIARQNIAFAIGVKVAVLILATFGLSTLGMAVFADVGVTVLAVLNAMRAGLMRNADIRPRSKA